MRIKTLLVGNPQSKERNTCQTRAAPEGGFSLLELLTVLCLLALLMGLVLPSLQRTWKREQFHGSVRQFAATLRGARGAAASQQRRVRVFLDVRTGNYWREDTTQKGSWPAGMRLADPRLVWQTPEAQQGYIAFYSDGSSSGGGVDILDPDGRRYKVEVKMITGQVVLTTES